MSTIGGNLKYSIPDLHERGWKDETDTSFAILDKALSGTHIIDTTGGNTVVPGVDGAADEGRALRVAVIGALTSNAIIGLPPLTKLWLLANGTTGAFVVQVWVGSTHIDVPQGQHLWVYSDGANIIPISGLLPGSVPTAALANGAVTEEKVAAGAITLLKHGPDSVDGNVLKEASVGNAHFAPGVEGSIVAMALALQQFPTLFVSPPQAVGYVNAVGHGLGGLPKKAWAEFHCWTADLGYAPGDVVDISYVSGIGNVWSNATGVGYAMHSTLMPLIDLGTGLAANATAGSWRIVLKAM